MAVTYTISNVQDQNPFDGLTVNLVRVHCVKIDGVVVAGQEYTFASGATELVVRPVVEADLISKGFGLGV